MELNLKKISVLFHAGNLGISCIQSITENPITALCGFAFRGLMFEVTRRVIHVATSSSSSSSFTSSSVEEHA